MNQRPPSAIWGWGGTRFVVAGARRFAWIDLLVAVGLVAILFSLVDVAKEWAAPHAKPDAISLSLSELPRYTLLSLSRGLLAYVMSLGFTLVYGYWAAKDERAARLLIPLLDVLQSLPVLAFLPGLVLALNALFPRNNVGLELAAVVMIFTGQAWNMTFSFYHSLRSIPHDQLDAASIFRFTPWQRLRWVELPHATLGLVWNSMMSMAGGWFFLMINECYQLGDQDFRLPGLGSYMQVAVTEGRTDAMIWAMLAMLLMIVGLDQVVWRPVVVWAQKFRVEEGADSERMASWLLTALRQSRLRGVIAAWSVRRIASWRARWPRRAALASPPAAGGMKRTALLGQSLSVTLLVALLGILAMGGWTLARLLASVAAADWLRTLALALATLARVLASTAIGTLWAVPAGIAIGTSPRWSRLLQPIVQIAASFPAPMLFPMVIAGLKLVGIALDFGAILLMLLGTQWYILFNVIAGAMSIPTDLREAARSFRLGGWREWRVLLLPAVFPYLVTGWVTAAGGAWNASIVAEYVTFHGETLQATGLGGQINHATASRNFPLLAASVATMAVVVVLLNRLVWKRLYRIAEDRYSLSK